MMGRGHEEFNGPKLKIHEILYILFEIMQLGLVVAYDLIGLSTQIRHESTL